MRRIGLAVVVIVGLLTLPLAAASQSPEKHRIGYLASFLDDPKHPIQEAFIGGLRDHGYVEGRNLSIEAQVLLRKARKIARARDRPATTQCEPDRHERACPQSSGEGRDLHRPYRLRVTVADPIGIGLVTNYRHPGGNVTGLATIEFEAFTAKQLEIIKEALPKASRIAILMNPTNPTHPGLCPRRRRQPAC